MSIRQPAPNTARRSWDLLVLLVAVLIGLIAVGAFVGPLPPAAAGSLLLLELLVAGAVLTMARSHGRALR